MDKQKVTISETLKNILLIFFIFITTGGCGVMDISKYEGDGTIESLGSWPFSKGYAIRLDTFSTDEAFQGTYTIANLPKSYKSYDIGLEIITQVTEYSMDNIKNKLKGYLGIKIESKDGDIIVQWQDELKNWNFSETYYDSNFTRCFVSPSHRSVGGGYFDYAAIKRKQPLKIYISYYPQEDEEALKAEILIENGGYY